MPRAFKEFAGERPLLVRVDWIRMRLWVQGESEPRKPFVRQQLEGATGPIVAVSDYMKAVPDQIRQFLPNEFATLGADGFGFSDTRAAARRFFKIDSHSIVVRALEMLARRGEVDQNAPKEAFDRYKLNDVTAGTSGNAGGDS